MLTPSSVKGARTAKSSLRYSRPEREGEIHFCILCQVRARQEKATVNFVIMFSVRTDASGAQAPWLEDEAFMDIATHGADALTARLGSLEELV